MQKPVRGSGKSATRTGTVLILAMKKTILPFAIEAPPPQQLPADHRYPQVQDSVCHFQTVQAPKLRDGGREGREGRKPDGNSILYIPPTMACRVDRERSILGTELEEPKLVAREGEGTGSCLENVTHAQGNLARLAPWGLKLLKRRVGCGGKGPENSSQSRPFLPLFHRCIDTGGKWLIFFCVRTLIKKRC
jgi:hypothetical protein